MFLGRNGGANPDGGKSHQPLNCDCGMFQRKILKWGVTFSADQKKKIEMQKKFLVRRPIASRPLQGGGTMDGNGGHVVFTKWWGKGGKKKCTPVRGNALQSVKCTPVSNGQNNRKSILGFLSVRAFIPQITG